MMNKLIGLLLSLLLGLLVFFTNNCFASDEIIVPVASDIEITVERFPSSGKYLMLWLAPEYGFRVAHQSMAQMLVKQNIEVWQSNIVESLFLPQGTKSQKQLDGKYVADVIEYAHKTTGKKIVVVGDSYASVSVLLGAHHWQQRKQTDPYLIGAMLFSPYTYAYIPPLGLPAEFMPIVSATNIPIMIYQAEKSGNIGQFDLLLEKLRQNGSPVYTQVVPGVMSLFYEDIPTSAMEQGAKPLPRDIRKMLAVLEKHAVPSVPIPLPKTKVYKSGIDVVLKKFKGGNKPFTINLIDIDGNVFSKVDFKGQVTLVNFWATWCTPCIKEIPMLNRLKKKMTGFPFELISINYAEDRKTILDFLKKVNVEFPVLLDKNGDFARKWRVISYPSTFVIDARGNIKFGVNAAIEWDDPEFVKKLKSLL